MPPPRILQSPLSRLTMWKPTSSILLQKAISWPRMWDCPHIKLLVDYFHWVRNKEPLEELDQCASMLVHAHFAEDIGRAYPSEPKEITTIL